MKTEAGRNVRDDGFVSRMAAYIGRHGLLEDGQPVVVGVSGGADSVALAWAMVSLGRYVVHVAHVNHGLRDDATADATFAADVARRLAVPFHLERIETRAIAARGRMGVEEAGRFGRYEALSSVALRVGADAVAVAHHADDQVETVLHRIARGTHLRGLAGMAAKRPLGQGLSLIRPLLWARRSRIEHLCRAEGLDWRTDRTNAQTDFTRNFIRHDLLGLLRSRLNPRVDEALLRLASAAEQAESVLAELADRLFERSCRKRSAEQIVLRAAPLKKAPPLLASLALRAALVALEAPQQALSQERFDDLLSLVAGTVTAVDLPGGVRGERRGQSVLLRRSGPDGGDC